MDGDGCKNAEDPDDDGDGLADAVDPCDLLGGPTGCPLAARTVTLKYARATRRISGRLACPTKACVGRVRITLRRVRPGADPVVVRVTTSATGTYARTLRLPRGQYYVEVAASTVADLARCAAARSGTLRVR